MASFQQQVNHIFRGNTEALRQGAELISNLSDRQYSAVVGDIVSSSIGQHFRHILDMYWAIIQSLPASSAAAVKTVALIDYDFRRRGAPVEYSREAALAEITEIQAWLEGEHLHAVTDCGDYAMQLKTEVCLHETQAVTLPSSLLRELIFVGSHAVHHYALIRVIAKLQGVELAADLGVAPATASFLREQDAE